MTLEDLYRLLRTGHVQAQGVFETIDQPLLVLNEHLCVESANPAFYAAFHVSRDDTIGERLSRLGNGQWDIPALTLLLEQVIPRSSAVIGYEVTHSFPALGRRTMLVSARRLVHPDNSSLYMLVVFEDITERRREEAGRDLVSREIEHRLRNFFVVVSALARQVPAEGKAAEQYREAFVERLEVLANAELGLFSAEGNDLASLTAAVLAPYGARIKLERACAVTLDRDQVRSISMLLHELATNALKHGALSAEGGMVRIGWSVSENSARSLRFDWREEGGPPVAEKARDGFGSRLIESLVKVNLQGRIDSRYAPDGLTVHVEVPLGAKGPAAKA